jgi:hypothetical protein
VRESDSGVVYLDREKGFDRVNQATLRRMVKEQWRIDGCGSASTATGRLGRGQMSAWRRRWRDGGQAARGRPG